MADCAGLNLYKVGLYQRVYNPADTGADPGGGGGPGSQDPPPPLLGDPQT